MVKSDHYAKLEKMYLSARINKAHYPSTIIQINDRLSEISVEIDESYHHALGAMHGSVYFKLLDDAAFFAAQSIVKDVFVLTANFNIHFTRPQMFGKITATGKVDHATNNLIIASAILKNDKGKIIAQGTGSFMKSGTLLSPEIGYQ